MKKITISLVFILTMISCDSKQKKERVSIITSDDREKLTFLKEVEWPKAYREQDTVLLDRILNDDFEMISNNGTWTNKTDELNWIKENKTSNDSFYYKIKRLSIYENGTAIIAGTGHVFNDGKESRYESSNILIKKGELWKAITSHVSGIREVEETKE